MQFFLTVPHDSAEEPTMESMDPAELEAALAAVEKFNADLHESGAFRFAGGLHPPSSAKTVDALMRLSLAAGVDIEIKM